MVYVWINLRMFGYALTKVDFAKLILA